MVLQAVVFPLCALLVPSGGEAVAHPGGEESTAYKMSVASAVEAFNRGAYEEALRQCGKASAHAPDAIEPRYIRALCYRRLGRTSDALAELEDLERKAPHYRDVELELAICYFETGRFRLALQKLLPLRARYGSSADYLCYVALTEAALGNRAGAEKAIEELEAIAPETASLVAVRIGAAGRGREKKFRLYATAGYTYDSNVTLLPFDTTAAEISGKDDFRFATSAIFDARPVKWSGGGMDTRFGFVQSVHNRLSDYNLQGYTVGAALSQKIGRIDPYVAFDWGYYFLENAKQSYLRSAVLSAGVDVTEGTACFTRFDYRWSINDYMLPFFFRDDDRDGTNHMIGASQYFLLSPSRGSFVRLGGYFDRENATGKNYFYNGYSFDGEVYVPLAWRTAVDFLGRYYIKDYRRSVYNRYDDRQHYIVTLDKRIGEHFELVLQYQLIVNDSTVGIFEFDRNLYTLMAAVRY